MGSNAQGAASVPVVLGSKLTALWGAGRVRRERNRKWSKAAAGDQSVRRRQP